MGKIINLTGMKFNRLLVVSKNISKTSSGAYWFCLCDCGNSTVVASLKLRLGSTKSCGCKRKDGTSNYKHGHSGEKTKTYRSWKEMRQRCLNPNSDKWKWYGGRGIDVCDSWSKFENFLADMGERPEGTSIDRINSDGNYESNNCRWATPKQQAETNRGCFKKINGVAAK